MHKAQLYTHTRAYALPNSEGLRLSEMNLVTFAIFWCSHKHSNVSGPSHNDVIGGPLSDTLLMGDCKGRTHEEEHITSVWNLNCLLSLSNQRQGNQPEFQTYVWLHENQQMFLCGAFFLTFTRVNSLHLREHNCPLKKTERRRAWAGLGLLCVVFYLVQDPCVIGKAADEWQI